MRGTGETYASVRAWSCPVFWRRVADANEYERLRHGGDENGEGMTEEEREIREAEKREGL